jgi:hypothetical protein
MTSPVLSMMYALLAGCSAGGDKQASEAPPKIVAQSSVAKGMCKDERNYYYQGVKLEDGTLCTRFAWDEFIAVPKDWKPEYNPEAKKRYCFNSNKDPCFLP